jgi:hypothetical protein
LSNSCSWDPKLNNKLSADTKSSKSNTARNSAKKLKEKGSSSRRRDDILQR